MTVKVTTDGKRILADIPYRLRFRVKDVAGSRAKWDKTVTPNKFLAWTYPLTMDSCRALRRVFGTELEILPPLAAWAKEALKQEADMEAIRSGEVVGLGNLRSFAPQLALAMDARPYQLNGASFMLTGGATLLGDQPGLGKTLQTLGALVDRGCQRILVACPKTATRTVWARETERWTNIETYVAQGSHAEREHAMVSFWDRQDINTPKMLIINTEMIRAKKSWICPDGVRTHKPPGKKGGCYKDHEHKHAVEYSWPFLFEKMWDAIIMDESHQFLASTRNIQSDYITQGRLGAVHLRRMLKRDGLAVALSGTPFRSDLTKAWGTLNWLRPDVFGSYWQWAETHFKVVDDPSGYGKIVSSEPQDEDAFNAAMRPYYLARDKATVAPDLPPIFYAGTPIVPEDPDSDKYVQIPMEGKQATAYDEMVSEATAHVDGGKLLANGVLAELTRLRQFACAYGFLDNGEFYPELPSNKFDWVLEFLAERKGNSGKVVIASCFTRLIEMMAAKLREDGHDILTLTGKTNDRARETLVRRFADPDDPARVAIINVQAGGVAITLDQADDMILTDLPWTSDEEEQVIDRIHRVSRIHNVTVYRLLSEGTVDTWIAGLTDEQRKLLKAAKQETRAMFKEAVA